MDPDSLEGRYIEFLRKKKLNNLIQKIKPTEDVVVDVDKGNFIVFSHVSQPTYEHQTTII